MLAVVEFLPDAVADLEAQLGRYRHIAGIEQAVNVASQKQAIAGLVHSAVAEGTDVGRFQRRQRSLLGNGTTPTVDIGDQYAEGALPQSRTHEMWLSETLICELYNVRLA